MKKHDRNGNVVKSLAEIGKVGASVTVGGLRIPPALGKLDLLTPVGIRQLTATLTQSMATITENVILIVSSLADPATYRNVVEQLWVQVDQVLVSYIKAWPTKPGRADLTVALIGGVVEIVRTGEFKMPSESKPGETEDVTGAFDITTEDGEMAARSALNFIADLGLRLGFWRKADNGTDVSRGVQLPVTVENRRETHGVTIDMGGNRWERQLLVCDLPASMIAAIFSGLREISGKLDAKRRDEIAIEVAVLKEGADELTLEQAVNACVNEQRESTIVVHVPGEQATNRFYPAADIKITIKDGEIFPITAVGRSKGVVERAAETRLGIPVTALVDGQLNFPRRLPQEAFTAMIVTMKMLQRVLHAAEQRAERARTKKVDGADKGARKNLRGDATLNAHDVIVDGKKGTAVIYLKDSDIAVACDFLVECDGDGKVRIVDHNEAQWDEAVGKVADFTLVADLPEPFCAIFTSLKERMVANAANPQARRSGGKHQQRSEDAQASTAS
ncbi:MAG: hypothetical protein AAB372_00475 [Patescibacteria group bacterium]